MKITHNVALNFHPIFIPLNQLFGAILDFGFWPPARRGHKGLRPGGITDLLYRVTLSFFIKSIRLQLAIWRYRRRTLNQNSKFIMVLTPFINP